MVRPHLQVGEVEPLRVVAQVAPQRVEGAQRVDAHLELAEQRLHAGPEALQRVEERPRHLRRREQRGVNRRCEQTV